MLENLIVLKNPEGESSCILHVVISPTTTQKIHGDKFPPQPYYWE